LKPLNFALCVVFAFSGLSAQTPVWQPSPGHTQQPIWPGAAPDPQPVAGPEIVKSSGKDDLVGGKRVVVVSNVSRPTMTVYSPSGKNTGAAGVVFPGGGYQILAIDLEGTEVCDWLAFKGITCVLLKYRVTNVGPHPKSGPYPESPMALEDAQRVVARLETGKGMPSTRTLELFAKATRTHLRISFAPQGLSREVVR
jgi:acetyl esterase/lipase